MILRRFYDDVLAQASYLLACEQTRRAVIVDPNLDLAQYIDAAAGERVTIACVTETHIHADFVSASRALADATGARLALSAEGGTDWQYRLPEHRSARLDDAPILLHDGDELQIGTLTLRAMHTPGHTPEHLAFLVTDTTVSSEPVGMLSGDFIFVGDVGRPDLLERAAHVEGTMERSARDLYASLRRAAGLPDYLQLWPGHGAGSACGKALGALPQSTMGYERIANPALRHTSEEAFVRSILAAQPEPPRYFARMKRVNRDGMPAGSPVTPRAPRRLAPAEVLAAIGGGMLVVDTRPSAEFLRGHLPGTVCVPRSKSFLTYFAAIAPEECPVALLTTGADAADELARWLHLVGFDDVRGWAPAAELFAASQTDGTAAVALESIGLEGLRTRLGSTEPPLLIDVRTASERELGAIPGSVPVPLNALEEWALDTTGDPPAVVHCQTGSRAVVAASLLRARGFTQVIPMTGGYEAWSNAGLPVHRSSSP